MTTASDCAWCGEWERAVAYVAGDLGPEDEERVELHLFDCTSCATSIATAGRLGAGVREAARAGTILAVAAGSYVDKLRSEGVRVQEHRVVDGAVDAWFDRDANVLVVPLSLDLGGNARLDVEFENEWDGYVQVERGVPVRAGEPLFIACTRHHFTGASGVLHAKCRIRRADDADRALVTELALTLHQDAQS